MSAQPNLNSFTCTIIAVTLLALAMTSTSIAQVQTNDAEQQSKRFFARNDQNKDGKLSKNEFPEQFRRMFERMDTDNDGSVSSKEDIQFRQARIGAANRNRIPEETLIHKDIAYVTNGHLRQKLDLYLPAAKTKIDRTENLRPLVIWIHGGGWRNGDKKNCPARFLVQYGFAVASINYRLSEHAKFPAQIQDCQLAIQFLRQNSKKYAIDPNRFGAWGSSAGGHLVALLGTCRSRSFVAADGLKISTRVQAVCDFYGPTDLLTIHAQSGPRSRINHDEPDSPEGLLLGGAIPQNKDAAKSASPITYVSEHAPPFLIVHGDDDQLVPIQQSIDFHQKLLKAGVDSTLHIVKGGGHGGFDETKRVLEFFQRTLLSASAHRASVIDALIFESKFDRTTDANLFDNDGWIYTARSMARKIVEQGVHTPSVKIHQGAGVSGDYLRFNDKTNQVLLYKAIANGFSPRPDWSGSISFWLRLDPDKDLKPGFCDPIQIAQRKWNDGAIWVDFEDKKPRTFRLGVFSDFKVWNPENKKYAEIPAEKKPMVTVENPPFSSDRWTHVAITFADINSASNEMGTARLYLNAELKGTIRQRFKINWTTPSADSAELEPAIMLGLSYIGDMDELTLYNRALSADEIAFLHNQFSSSND